MLNPFLYLLIKDNLQKNKLSQVMFQIFISAGFNRNVLATKLNPEVGFIPSSGLWGEIKYRN
jgi:hypothetical protein